ncbi:MAG TPA: hypothetical protein VMA75_01685 [Candidatus Paceibacterota bacterium]|nr:hypothetical protein [Candidatus Paceibacterota bacterium]
MKLPKEFRKREYRVLALAIAFFALGSFFFFADRSYVPQEKTAAGTAAEVVAPSADGAPISPAEGSASLNPQFSDYPAPSRFRTFAFANGKIDDGVSLTVTSTCADAYVAVLVFPASVDYRADIDREIYDSAFPCVTTGDVASTTIIAGDLGNAPSGTYYYFTADQGASGVWYNPK